MKVIIEIPKGDDSRRHIKYDKTGFVDLGKIKDVIPINKGKMPFDYGYIPGTYNEEEGDELDVIVLSDRALSVGQEITTHPIALIKRADRDDKIVAVDDSINSINEWQDISQKDRKLIKDFFGYNSRITVINDAKVAVKNIKNAMDDRRTSRQII